MSVQRDILAGLAFLGGYKCSEFPLSIEQWVVQEPHEVVCPECQNMVLVSTWAHGETHRGIFGGMWGVCPTCDSKVLSCLVQDTGGGYWYSPFYRPPTEASLDSRFDVPPMWVGPDDESICMRCFKFNVPLEGSAFVILADPVTEEDVCKFQVCNDCRGADMEEYGLLLARVLHLTKQVLDETG